MLSLAAPLRRLAPVRRAWACASRGYYAPMAAVVKEEQTTSTVLMVKPANFFPNKEALEDNKFMKTADDRQAGDVSLAAFEEWKGLAKQLRASGVEVRQVNGLGFPDELFPNNWFSTHADGRVVIYPMKAVTRAREVRHDVVEKIRSWMHLDGPVFNLTGWRASNLSLEGTGSLVLDRANKVAYMNASGRADRSVGRLWAQEMGYRLVVFRTADRAGSEIYHTNVMLSVGENVVVICSEAIADAQEREEIVAELRASKRLVVDVTLEQMESFACNALELRSSDGRAVLAISKAGWDAFTEQQRQSISGVIDEVVAAAVPTIEKIGGGSVRCMLAELFPRAPVSAYVGAPVGQKSGKGGVEMSGGQLAEGAELCQVNDETGKLSMVIVHEPGLETDAAMPWTIDAMKVDECFNRPMLKAEHRDFSRLLSSRGAQVFHVRDMLTEISHQSESAKYELLSAVWGEEYVDRAGLRNLEVDNLIKGVSREALKFEQPPLMNLFFMRDPAFCVPGGWVVISHPMYKIRQMESTLLRTMFRLHPTLRGVKVFGGLADDPEVRIEGGDVLVSDKETVMVGISQRTNERGADKLAEFLFENTPVQRVVKVFIPKQRAFMHLDTIFSYVDKGAVITMPYFWSKPEVYAEVCRRANDLNLKMDSTTRMPVDDWTSEPPRVEILVRGQKEPKRYRKAMEALVANHVIDKVMFVCGSEGSWPSPEEHVVRALVEQWCDAANVFCISPGTVVGYKWCHRTVTHLQDNGIEVVELNATELMKGRGGARCLTMPLQRLKCAAASATTIW